jgi:stearoyl-CoA desaturase (delta-9 desaturase)
VRSDLERFDPAVCVPILAMHAGCLLIFWTGASSFALSVCAACFVVRMFGITAGYHRYFAHRAYRTSRPFRLLLGVLGASACQLGPLWWAGHHRRHHRHADTERDPHAPGVRGAWWAHMGWLLCRKHLDTPWRDVPDLARHPELRALERWHALAPLSLALGLFALGSWLERAAPPIGTSGLELLAWGFFVSTVLLYHTVFAVNSLGHTVGARRFASGDKSRNVWWLALPTLGDAWHNNHHFDPPSARHGIGRYELDLAWLALRALERLGLVWDLRHPARAAGAAEPAGRAQRWLRN